jgi:hypothetical protein
MLMRREHLAIERYLVDMDRAVARSGVMSLHPTFDDFLRAYGGLTAVLADHNVKEERRLFPIIDRTTAASDRYELFRRIIIY